MNKFDELRNTIYYNLPPGPRFIKAAWVANFFKGTTSLLIIALMYIYQNFTLQAYVYLAAHGSYGIIWVAKSIVFPDRNFEQKMTLMSALGGSCLLCIYWIIPYNMMSSEENKQNNYSIIRICFCLLLYIFGLSLMLVADCQKFFELKHRGENFKGQTIKNGVFSTSRNPNYLGESMLYLSFSVLSNNIISYGIIGFVWMTVFAANIACKEHSFQKKPDWQEYSKSTWIFFPKIIPSSQLLSLSLYGIIFSAITYYSPCLSAF